MTRERGNEDEVTCNRTLRHDPGQSECMSYDDENWSRCRREKIDRVKSIVKNQSNLA